MRLLHRFAVLLIPVGLAGCVAPGPGYGGGGYYGRPAYGGYGGGYRAPVYGGYGGGYRDQGYARQAPPRNDGGGGWGGGQRQAAPRPNDGGGWGGGQRQAPQAGGGGSPQGNRALAIEQQRQTQSIATQ